MNKNEVSLNYRVGVDGRIESPGKFEGMPWWTVSLWEASLHGMCEEFYDAAGNVYIDVTLTDADRDTFDTNAARVILWEDHAGFVHYAADIPNRCRQATRLFKEVAS